MPRELYLAFAQQAAGETAKAKQAYSNVDAAVGAMLAKQSDSAELHLALATDRNRRLLNLLGDRFLTRGEQPARGFNCQSNRRSQLLRA